VHIKTTQEATNMTNEKALNAYAATIDDIRETLAALLEHADDHFGTAPENINWGHVGSANYVRENLNEIAVFLKLKEEDA